MSEKQVVDAVRSLKDFWNSRTLRIQEMYRLRKLTDENKVEGYESIVANDPKTFFNLAQYMISALPAKHKLPIKADSPITQEQKGRSERGLISSWKNQDIKMFRQGRRPWRWELADHILISGWYAVYAGVFKDGKGNLDFVADILNPMGVYQEFGEDGLLQCSVEYKRNITTVKKMVQSRIDDGDEGWVMPPFLANHSDNIYGGDITMESYWVVEGGQVKNSILANGVTCLGLTEIPNVDRIPIITGPTGGEASWGGWGDGDADWKARIGQSILEPNAEMYKHQSKMLTKLAKIVDRHAEPPMVDENAAGDALLDSEDVEDGKIIHRRTGDRVYPVETRTTPDLYNYQAMIEQKVQQGSVPYTLYGAVPPALDLSGFAIGLLMTAAQNIVGPYHVGVTNVMGEVDRIWLEGFKASKKTIQISGRSRPSDSGSVFIEDWSYEDVPDSLYVDVTVPLATPSDLLERVTIARQAKPMGDLLDEITILEEIINVDDPKLVKDRLDAQAFAQMPEVQMLKMVVEAKKKEAEFRQADNASYADIMAAFAERVMATLGGQAPQGQAPAPRPGIPPQVGGTEMAQGGVTGEQMELLQRGGGSVGPA